MIEKVVTLAQAGTMAALAARRARYGGPTGPSATITREPGQIRKEAATAGTLCAGVWLVGTPPITPAVIGSQQLGSPTQQLLIESPLPRDLNNRLFTSMYWRARIQAKL